MTAPDIIAAVLILMFIFLVCYHWKDFSLIIYSLQGKTLTDKQRHDKAVAALFPGEYIDPRLTAEDIREAQEWIANLSGKPETFLEQIDRMYGGENDR